MDKKKRPLFLSMLLITLGVMLTTVMKEDFGSLGIVFIAIGGLLFIISMAGDRYKSDNKSNEETE